MPPISSEMNTSRWAVLGVVPHPTALGRRPAAAMMGIGTQPVLNLGQVEVVTAGPQLATRTDCPGSHCAYTSILSCTTPVVVLLGMFVTASRLYGGAHSVHTRAPLIWFQVWAIDRPGENAA